MTNDELQAFNTQNLRVFCRGKRQIPEETLLALNEKRIAAMNAQDFAGLLHLVTELAGIFAQTLALDGATLSDLNLECVKLMDVRYACGEDVSVIVGAPPYDGEKRTVPCPACENPIVWRSAVSDEVRATASSDKLAKLSALAE